MCNSASAYLLRGAQRVQMVGVSVEHLLVVRLVQFRLPVCPRGVQLVLCVLETRHHRLDLKSQLQLINMADHRSMIVMCDVHRNARTVADDSSPVAYVLRGEVILSDHFAARLNDVSKRVVTSAYLGVELLMTRLERLDGGDVTHDRFDLHLGRQSVRPLQQVPRLKVNDKQRDRT